MERDPANLGNVRVPILLRAKLCAAGDEAGAHVPSVPEE